VRACSPLACLLLVLAAAVLALALYAWLVSWLNKTLAWVNNVTEWLLANATEKICQAFPNIPPR